MTKQATTLLHEDVSGYLRDESRQTGHAENISFPLTEADISKILAQLGAKTPVTIQGARTGISAGAVPFGGHIMNLARQTNILGMRLDDAGCFSLLVQPGVVLSVMDKAIADKKFNLEGWSPESLEALAAFKNASAHFFPPDPTEVSATIGGMAACNASGAQSFRYGPMRNYIKGLRIVLADGDMLALQRGQFKARGRLLTLVTTGGRSIDLQLPTYTMPQSKCASGYYIEDNLDAVDLFIGMDGTLGIITELELALIPLPPVIWGATFFFKDHSAALEFVIQARNNQQKKVAALEYFDANVLEILRAQKLENPAFAKLPLPTERFDCAIYAELHCTSEEDAYKQLFALGAIAEQAGGSEADTWVARTKLEHDSLIGFRHAAPECVNMIIDNRRKNHPSITKLGTDLAVPDNRLTEIMALYRTRLQETGLEYAVWGHIGDNHVHVNILPKDEAEYQTGKDLYLEWAQKVVAIGGAVSAEHGIGKLKTEQFALMYNARHFAEMRALKLALDPHSILGRGNIFPSEDTK